MKMTIALSRIYKRLRLLKQKPEKRITFKLGRKLTIEEIEKKIEEGLEEMVD